ncbi:MULTISPECIES: hypothetical protein [unclassified Acinetobacter]|uniref:A1S_2505 family phage non-structural protein n=1 Tax=unclassified Acinetobacter TaxID=196816 RepID=UPI0029343037|nr:MULTISPECIES: hypothetical protein [unclassified Acinetobacter]WOE31640.1 hypothetical protein QSG84_15275 [Acinetobacter sp. SAAs470]WOE37105.1 hypothetical protein QSG86_08940 [Acinetobacter sp. SAAs474]
MTYHYHNESIIKTLAEDTIFVFGSNLAGQHNEGAAKIAQRYFGAVDHVGRGWAGQSFAIPTMNEHLQQMPLSQIQHYIDDFKIYTQNHPDKQYFITAIGCGTAGYKVEEIAPMFKGISHNVILPVSFRPFVEKALPKLTQHFLHTFFAQDILLAQDSYRLIDHLALTDSEKNLAKILNQTEMYPTDSNGRDRVFEIEDILYQLHRKHISLQGDSTATQQHSGAEALNFGGMVLALLELYNINEQDFIDAWQGIKQISPPHPMPHSQHK